LRRLTRRQALFAANNRNWVELTGSRDEYGRTPLHLAIENNHYEVTEDLLRYGADPNALDANKFSPLLAAAQLRRSRIILLLLRYGANNGVRSGSSAASPAYYYLRQYSDPNLALGLLCFAQLLDTKEWLRPVTLRGLLPLPPSPSPSPFSLSPFHALIA